MKQEEKKLLLKDLCAREEMTKEEALKIVRENMHLSLDKGHVFEALKILVPELEESEDERIRKELIDFINHYRHNTDLTSEQAEWCKKALAYLERQKNEAQRQFNLGMQAGREEVMYEMEKKQNIYKSSKSEIDFADRYSKDVWEKLMSKFKAVEGYSIGCNDVSDIVLNAILNAFKWQKEQKPAEMDNEEIELSDFESELFSVFSDGWQQYLHGEEVDVAQWAKEHSAQLLNAAKQELKPAEWNIDNAKPGDILSTTFDDFTNIVMFISLNDGYIEGYGMTLKDGKLWVTDLPNPHYSRTWTSTLEPATKEQIKTFIEIVSKPAEWSEEDEAAFGDLMWCIEQARKSAKDENDMGDIWFAENWVKNRLKSLRPKPHWKPSKEQIEAVYNILHPDDPYYDELKSLYEDLKKLL